VSAEYLKELITRRRTRKPALFSKEVPDRESIIQLIDTARHAPNHHNTEPARFYLLDSKTIETVGRLFGEVVAGNGSDPVLVEKGERKKKEWGTAPGLLVVTCRTDRASVLVQKKPAIIEEDYATCSCICQNLALLFEAQGLACKWSTGPVWEHPQFAETVRMREPENERVVALLFYGYSDQKLTARPLAPLSEHLISEY
jgi:nitroreductase